MTQKEIEGARNFDDAALICHKYIVNNQDGTPCPVYTLRVPITVFRHIPAGIELVNNNNDLTVKTIEDLLGQIIKLGGKILTVQEAAVLDQAAHERWLDSRPNTVEWNTIVARMSRHLPVEPAPVMDYLERLERRYAQN